MSRSKIDSSGPGFCPICGDTPMKNINNHIKRCEGLPSAIELKQMLDDNPDLTISGLANKFHVHINRIKGIILRGRVGITEGDLRERGIAIRARKIKSKKRSGPVDYINNRFPCAGGCGLMVEMAGYYCKYCVLDENGIRNLNDLRRRNHSPEVMAVVLANAVACYASKEL